MAFCKFYDLDEPHLDSRYLGSAVISETVDLALREVHVTLSSGKDSYLQLYCRKTINVEPFTLGHIRIAMKDLVHVSLKPSLSENLRCYSNPWQVSAEFSEDRKTVKVKMSESRPSIEGRCQTVGNLFSCSLDPNNYQFNTFRVWRRSNMLVGALFSVHHNQDNSTYEQRSGAIIKCK